VQKVKNAKNADFDVIFDNVTSMSSSFRILAIYLKSKTKM